MRWLGNFRHCSGESTTLERRGKKPEFLRSVEQQQYDAVKVREMKADKHRNNKMLPTHSVKREIFLGSSETKHSILTHRQSSYSRLDYTKSAFLTNPLSMTVILYLQQAC